MEQKTIVNSTAGISGNRRGRISFVLFCILDMSMNLYAQQNCTEVGRVSYSDYGQVSASMPTSLFIGAWTRTYQTSGSKGNDYPYAFCGTGGGFEVVSGNTGGQNYNANTMARYPGLYTWQGDFAYYQHEAPSLQACYDWVYVGVYTQHSGNTSVQTLWVKFGPSGVIQSTTTDVVNVSISPNTLWIGSSWANPSHMYMQYLRVYAMSAKPTTAQIEAIAQRTTPDPTAWGDWPLIAGGTQDVSGNGHAITVTGTWYSGVAGPALSPTAVATDSHLKTANKYDQSSFLNGKLSICGISQGAMPACFTIAGKILPHDGSALGRSGIGTLAAIR
jgi:hypothetical protein